MSNPVAVASYDSGMCSPQAPVVSEDQAVMPSKAAGRDGLDTGLQGCSILASEGDNTTIEMPPEKLFLTLKHSSRKFPKGDANACFPIQPYVTPI